MSSTSDLKSSRIVIWNCGSLDMICLEDRTWLSELLKSLSLLSVQDLNGKSRVEIGENAHRLDETLQSSDVGRLADVDWPRPNSQRMANHRQLLLSQNVDILELSVRPANCLRNANISTIGELLQKKTEELLRFKNMGRSSVKEIDTKLQELLRNHPDETQLKISAVQQSFCLSALLSFEEAGIDEVIEQKLNDAAITRMDDLVTRSIESIRYWACLSGAEVCILQSQLGNVDLFLESTLPLWVRSHYVELTEAFQADLEQLRMTGLMSDSVASMSPDGTSSATCLEEELETFFKPNLSENNKQAVRRRLGWDGGPGATLEQAGQDLNVTRERVRQILARAFRRVPTKPVFLPKALECVELCLPATVERAERALVDAGITRGNIRVEAIARTAKYLDIPLTWSIEEWNGRQVVVNPAATRQILEFFAEARRRVSHYGTTSKDYVVADLSTQLTGELIDLYCSLLENVIWLDESHDWFWLPTGRNAVLSRLAKILRVAPRIALSVVRAGVLRDRRMETLELPPDIFRTLCASLPWCRVEGGELIAAGGIPEGEEDSNEMLLCQILSQFGPVMRRRELWKLATESGIEKVSFDSLLSSSNIIVMAAPEVYALIGSDIALLRDPIPERQDHAIEVSSQSEPEMPAELASGSPVFDRCDPESTGFHEQTLRSILARSERLREPGAWSMMELGLTEVDFEKLRRWGKLNTIHLRDLVGRPLKCGQFSATGIEAISLTFLAYCCAVGRNSGTEGELWPIVDAEIGQSLRGQLFANGYPKHRVRDATESICSKLNIRHVFGREGEQSWLRSVFLQFGITRSGWNKLPRWLASGRTLLPAAVEDLLRPISAVHSDSFGEFWQTLQRFRRQQLTLEQARKALTQSPWVYASEIDALLSAAVARPEIDHSEDTPDSDSIQSPDRLIGSPILTWHDEPRFELPINSRCRWLTASRYVLVLDNGKRFPLTRHQDEYTVELPHRKLEVDLSEAIVKVDLMRQQSSCLDEPIAIGLAPQGYDFAFYGLNGQMLPYGEERFESKGGYLICRSTCEVKGEPIDTYARRVFRGDWTIRVYRPGIPKGLEIHKGDIVLWTNHQQASRTANPIEKPKVVCGGGRWGQPADFTVELMDNAIPSHLLVNGNRMPLERTATGKFRGALVLSPNIDYDRAPVRVECESNGRLRWISARLQMGPLNGIAVETEEGWKVFKEAADMDAEYLRSHRVMTQVPAHFNGDQLGIEDWAWMEGDHFCGRPRNTASTIGGTLFALGESLRLSAGPYNRPSGGQRLARSVIHSGVVQWIEQDDDEYQIQLRSTFELGPQHAIWVWHEGRSEPEIVAGKDWIHVDDSCLVSLHPGAKPIAFAISFRGAWLGARTCRMGWNGFANLIRATQDWEQTARWLKWWRVPLLHEKLKTVVSERVVDSWLATIRASSLFCVGSAPRVFVGFEGEAARGRHPHRAWIGARVASLRCPILRQAT